MASDLTPYLGNLLLRWLNGDAAMPSSPSALYVGLFNGNPKTTGTEISTTIDATGRKAVTFGTLASGATHILTSDSDADFGNADGAATLTHFGLFDASSGGNCYAAKAVSGGPIAITPGTGVAFLAGAITFNVGSDT